jgi:hypothetical protein
MPLRRAGASNYYFVWRRQIHPRDNPQFLSQFKSDPSAMHDLRLVLADTFPGISLTILSDDQVLAGIARLVGAGELLLAREEPRHGGSAAQAADSEQTDAPAASAPTPSSPKAPPESQTLPSNTNAAAQAAALVAAAAVGAGVCPH